MLWFFADQVGLGSLLPLLQELPFGNVLFANWFLPGLALLLVIAIPNLLGVYFLRKHKPFAPRFIVGLGLVMIAWTVFEVLIFHQNLLTSIYLYIGLAQLITGIILTHQTKARRG